MLQEQQARMAKIEKRVTQMNTIVEKRERRKDQAAKRRANAKERQQHLYPRPNTKMILFVIAIPRRESEIVSNRLAIP